MNKMQELAKRAVSCKHWRWLPGMRAVGRKGSPDAWFRAEESLRSLHGDWRSALPDLDDPATAGCLLALVREAWDRSMLVAYYAPLESGQGWYVAHRFCGDRDYPVVSAPSYSEAEALVAALEDAP